MKIIQSKKWILVILLFPVSLLAMSIAIPFLPDTASAIVYKWTLVVMLGVGYLGSWAYGLLWLISNKDKLSRTKLVFMFIFCMACSALAGIYIYYHRDRLVDKVGMI